MYVYGACVSARVYPHPEVIMLSPRELLAHSCNSWPIMLSPQGLPACDFSELAASGPSVENPFFQKIIRTRRSGTAWTPPPAGPGWKGLGPGESTELRVGQDEGEG